MNVKTISFGVGEEHLINEDPVASTSHTTISPFNTYTADRATVND